MLEKRMTSTAPLETAVPVLIVGDGGAGLTGSMLLCQTGARGDARALSKILAGPLTAEIPVGGVR
jgi:hypothetical protein